jgi:hypothetical protein
MIDYFNDRDGESPRWANAIDALPRDGGFLDALSRSTVTNSGSVRAACRWLLSFLAKATTPDLSDCDVDPIRSYDQFIFDIEALEKLWPAVKVSLGAYQSDYDTEAAEATLAEFFVRRFPEAFRKTPQYQPPVTRAIALADRIDILCGLFLIGLKPNGSKDPFALRRAAINVLLAILPPKPLCCRRQV